MSPQALRCSGFARSEDLDPVGSAGSYRGVVLVEIPLPWPGEITEHPALAPAAPALEEANVRLQGLVPYGHSPPDRRRLVSFSRPAGPFDRYEGRAWTVSDYQVAEAVAALAASGGSGGTGGLEGDGTDAGRHVLVCTHGRRDACCGTLGTRLAQSLPGLGAGVHVWRTSHTGGHRFAPTALLLPEGTMWAYLDLDRLVGISDRTLDIDEAVRLYRGCTGLDGPEVQAADREGLRAMGWSWLGHRRGGPARARSRLRQAARGGPQVGPRAPGQRLRRRLRADTNPLAYLWNLVRWREDFLPGAPPDIALVPGAWTETAGELSFAALGDNGSGRRHAMAVARQMAQTYERSPYGVVLLAGDVCYYGHIDDRYDAVFTRPYRPLIDAGVAWELAVGNHDVEGGDGDRSAHRHGRGSTDEIAAELAHFGKDRSYSAPRHGPVEVFVVDSGMVLAGGPAAERHLAWLAESLAASNAPWKVALMHHPPYSSGRHGSSLPLRRAIEPVLAEGGVRLAFAGHDHHYERTAPQRGVVHVVSGGGCKLTLTGRSAFTAVAESVLHFVHVAVRGDTFEARAIAPGGRVVDRFTLRRG